MTILSGTGSITHRGLCGALARRLCGSGLLLSATLVASAAAAARPTLHVADEVVGCPAIGGRYVALLDAERGMLVLSAAPFPGGRPAGTAAGGVLRVELGDGSSWTIASAGDDAEPRAVWAARYSFRDRPATGCIAFDGDRFSAEGDLVSYLHWLAETVFARLPADDTGRRPPLHLAGRQVHLRITHSGSAPIELVGREGATLACRFADSPRVYLAIPYVLDAQAARLAVEVGSSEQQYWEAGAKTMLGFRVVAPGAPVTVDELGIAIAAVAVEGG